MFWLSVLGGLCLFLTPAILGLSVTWLLGDEAWGWLVFSVISLLVLLRCVMVMRDMARGGAFVAEQLFGDLVLPAGVTGKERQLCNLLHEMSLASGLPTPPVYILEGEAGINAFAAGYHQEDAVVGVTRGLVESLDRDAQQAVIAHVFSHIIHGDMRMNMQLCGIIAGLSLPLSLGRFLMSPRLSAIEPVDEEGLADAAASGAYGRPKGAHALLGGLIYGLGLPAWVLARILQSLASRERDFLADAAAIQFTRNPRGLSHALQVLQGHPSVLLLPWAADFGHFFFAEGDPAVQRSTFFGGLLNTHPPLEARIQRIGGPFELAPEGPPPGEDELFDRAPAQLLPLVTAPMGALTLVYASVLPMMSSEAQESLDEELHQELLRWSDPLEQLTPLQRVDLIDQSHQGLMLLSEDQARQVLDDTRDAAWADARLTLGELALVYVLRRRLHCVIKIKPPPAPQMARDQACHLLLSAMAHAAAAATVEETEAAFRAGIERLSLRTVPGALVPKAQCGPLRLIKALDVVEPLPASERVQLGQALRACAEQDERWSEREQLLIRTVFAALLLPNPFAPPLASAQSAPVA